MWPQYEFGPCIRVLPPAATLEFFTKFEAIPNSPNKVVVKEYIDEQTTLLLVNKSREIVLPYYFTNAARIKNQALFVGKLDRFEIWRPDSYKRQIAENVQAQPKL
jgi:DNA-binding transcriptional regulator/RsmH inhibitor MraZ